MCISTVKLYFFVESFTMFNGAASPKTPKYIVFTLYFVILLYCVYCVFYGESKSIVVIVIVWYLVVILYCICIYLVLSCSNV